MSEEDLLLVDLSSPQTFEQAHLANAIQVLPRELISGTRPAVGKLPGIDQLNALFSRIGYRPDQHIVAYDDEGGGWAGRFIWTLDVIGHKKTSYLNGGIHAWLAAKLPTTTELPKISPSSVNVSINGKFIASKADVLHSLDNPNAVIWDARTPEEHTGAKVVAARGGRIPGAVNLEWTEVMDRDHQLRIHPDVVELLDSRGISAEKEIITHCQTHHRSGFTYLVGKSLGYKIQAYDGSWSEWGNDPDTPIEAG
ncbi:MAG TPA: sulfurtransferase [Gammaproteobacteria bacterium]|nr:sulfurtransferase [Gammaproteobacteria bacterium]HIL94754.1 sulfurtransferase [Pseudomonadales bacterium]